MCNEKKVCSSCGPAHATECHITIPEKENGKLTVFSDHNGSLLRRQPRARGPCLYRVADTRKQRLLLTLTRYSFCNLCVALPHTSLRQCCSIPQDARGADETMCSLFCSQAMNRNAHCCCQLDTSIEKQSTARSASNTGGIPHAKQTDRKQSE